MYMCRVDDNGSRIWCHVIVIGLIFWVLYVSVYMCFLSNILSL